MNWAFFCGSVNGKDPACQCMKPKKCGFNPLGSENALKRVHGNPFQYSPA